MYKHLKHLILYFFVPLIISKVRSSSNYKFQSIPKRSESTAIKKSSYKIKHVHNHPYFCTVDLQNRTLKLVYNYNKITSHLYIFKYSSWTSNNQYWILNWSNRTYIPFFKKLFLDDLEMLQQQFINSKVSYSRTDTQTDTSLFSKLQ